MALSDEIDPRPHVVPVHEGIQRVCIAIELERQILEPIKIGCAVIGVERVYRFDFGDERTVKLLCEEYPFVDFSEFGTLRIECARSWPRRYRLEEIMKSTMTTNAPMILANRGIRTRRVCCAEGGFSTQVNARLLYMSIATAMIILYNENIYPDFVHKSIQ